jgi:NAD(P)-dependent dehydrogenase (short-subunit alcohol dehydrogenase family)
MSPETALSRITPQAIHACFSTNTIGPVLVCQAFEKLLVSAVDHGATDASPAIIANVSARVGSIGDNALGGWYSYR